jgi:hypothetical protein
LLPHHSEALVLVLVLVPFVASTVGLLAAAVLASAVDGLLTRAASAVDAVTG